VDKALGTPDSLVLHALMKQYGGYPSGWLNEDLSVCLQLLDVNAIISGVKKRQAKKQEAQMKSAKRRRK